MGLGQLPLLRAADFRKVEGHKSPPVVDEFTAPALEPQCKQMPAARYMSACKPEDLERAQKPYDHIGTAALKALGATRK